eukprot:gene1189-1502_t
MIKSIATFLLIVLVSIIGVKFAEAAYGVDISDASNIPVFQCLNNNGYNFAIIRCGRSNGQIDTNCPHSIYNAWEGGMAYVDIYIFPCPSCGDGYSQVQKMIQYVQSYEAKFGMVWLDIEGTQYWSSDIQTNRNFFNDMVQGAKDMNIPIGVYTSASQWSPIMGAWDGGSEFPLWYAHYDNSASFSDYRTFGGWSNPSIKQYMGDVSACGIGLDKNWYP